MRRVWEALAALSRSSMQMMKLLMGLGALVVGYVILSATGSPPKPWEETAPQLIVGEMAGFMRTIPSQKLPSVRLVSGGQDQAFSSFADGTPLVVNLWATWCAPCLEELPSLQALQDAMGADVRVLAIAMEPGDGTAQKAMLERLGAEGLILLQDPKLRLMQAYGSELQLPLTVLYDRRGREIGRLNGAADWASPEALRLVRAIAGGSYPG